MQIVYRRTASLDSSERTENEGIQALHLKNLQGLLAQSHHRAKQSVRFVYIGASCVQGHHFVGKQAWICFQGMGPCHRRGCAPWRVSECSSSVDEGRREIEKPTQRETLSACAQSNNQQVSKRVIIARENGEVGENGSLFHIEGGCSTCPSFSLVQDIHANSEPHIVQSVGAHKACVAQ